MDHAGSDTSHQRASPLNPCYSACQGLLAVRSVPRRGLLQRVPGVLRRLCPARARLRSPLALPDFSSVRPSAALLRSVFGSLSFGSGSGGLTFGACNTLEFIDAYLWHLPALPCLIGQRHRPAQAATMIFSRSWFNISTPSRRRYHHNPASGAKSSNTSSASTPIGSVVARPSSMAGACGSRS